MVTSLMAVALSFAFFLQTVAANNVGFLDGPGSEAAIHDEAFTASMRLASGCGSAGVSAVAVAKHAQLLQPIWQVLPKNRYGRVDWSLLRYVAHRHFQQRYSLLIRGLEPLLALDGANVGAAKLLLDHSPVEATLDGKRSHGFSVEDAAQMIAAIEQLLDDQDAAVLQRAYATHGRSTGGRLNHAQLADVMETYMVYWMLGDDEETISYLISNRSLREESVPHWNTVSEFVSGKVKSMEYMRKREPRQRHGRTAMLGRFDFDDAREAAGEITRTFAAFWEEQCQEIKAQLVELDRDGTGRVPIMEFYGENHDGQWRFGESEAYLRHLGALDESSDARGKQVIIPNYLQGANNCIVSTSSYFVCCINECEAIMNDIEETVGAPVAAAEAIVAIVGNMTDFEDERPALDSALVAMLRRIGERYDGKIPLHGRLFAQWLHYVFPRECPFPHRAGHATAISPTEFGNFEVTEEEVRQHAKVRERSGAKESSSRRNSTQSIGEEDLEELRHPWMSQWSEEEELLADYSSVLQSPWQATLRRFSLPAAASAVALVLLWVGGVFQPGLHGGKELVGGRGGAVLLGPAATATKHYHV